MTEKEESKGKYSKKRILAIDDAAVILRRITEALGKYYDVITVNSGERALRYLEDNKPDLILLDLRMKSKNGFETLLEIRAMEDRADIPVIMLTGVEDKRIVMEGIKLGISDYILKPFATDNLLERIRRALEPVGPEESAEAAESVEPDNTNDRDGGNV